MNSKRMKQHNKLTISSHWLIIKFNEFLFFFLPLDWELCVIRHRRLNEFLKLFFLLWYVNFRLQTSTSFYYCCSWLTCVRARHKSSLSKSWNQYCLFDHFNLLTQLCTERGDWSAFLTARHKTNISIFGLNHWSIGCHITSLSSHSWWGNNKHTTRSIFRNFNSIKNKSSLSYSLWKFSHRLCDILLWFFINFASFSIWNWKISLLWDENFMWEFLKWINFSSTDISLADRWAIK